jgi:hypothetical protein
MSRKIDYAINMPKVQDHTIVLALSTSGNYGQKSHPAET